MPSLGVRSPRYYILLVQLIWLNPCISIEYIKVYNAQSKIKNFHKKIKRAFFNPIDNQFRSEIQKNEHTLTFEGKTFSNYDIVTLVSHDYDKEKKDLNKNAKIQLGTV